jgi:trimethylamine:corrinoid methyltransferase-like protein
MRTWNSAEVLSPAEVQRLHGQALTILDEIGVRVQNRELLELFAELGARVDSDLEVIRFPRAWMESCVGGAREAD